VSLSPRLVAAVPQSAAVSRKLLPAGQVPVGCLMKPSLLQPAERAPGHTPDCDAERRKVSATKPSETCRAIPPEPAPHGTPAH